MNKSQKQNQFFINEVVKTLSETVVIDEPDKGYDALLWLSQIGHGDENGKLTIHISGSFQSFVALLSSTALHPGCPEQLKGAILIAAANILAATPNIDAKELGVDLGNYAESVHGEVECKCQKCMKKRADINNLLDNNQ